MTDLDLESRTLEQAHRSECSSCEAPIAWSVMEATGKRNPIDPKPDPDGRLVVVGWQIDPRHTVPVMRALKRDEWLEHQGARYTSHFATCPHAEEHRH